MCGSHVPRRTCDPHAGDGRARGLSELPQAPHTHCPARLCLGPRLWLGRGAGSGSWGATPVCEPGGGSANSGHQEARAVSALRHRLTPSLEHHRHLAGAHEQCLSPGGRSGGRGGAGAGDARLSRPTGFRACGRATTNPQSSRARGTPGHSQSELRSLRVSAGACGAAVYTAATVPASCQIPVAQGRGTICGWRRGLAITLGLGRPPSAVPG